MAQNFRMIEADFYGKITDKLKALFSAKGFEAYLETSVANGFSFDLIIHLWGGPPTLLIFLKQRHGRPDIAGFIKNSNGDKKIIRPSAEIETASAAVQRRDDSSPIGTKRESAVLFNTKSISAAAVLKTNMVTNIQ